MGPKGMLHVKNETPNKTGGLKTVTLRKLKFFTSVLWTRGQCGGANVLLLPLKVHIIVSLNKNCNILLFQTQRRVCKGAGPLPGCGAEQGVHVGDGEDDRGRVEDRGRL